MDIDALEDESYANQLHLLRAIKFIRILIEEENIGVKEALDLTAIHYGLTFSEITSFEYNLKEKYGYEPTTH